MMMMMMMKLENCWWVIDSWIVVTLHCLRMCIEVLYCIHVCNTSYSHQNCNVTAARNSGSKNLQFSYQKTKQQSLPIPFSGGYQWWQSLCLVLCFLLPKNNRSKWYPNFNQKSFSEMVDGQIVSKKVTPPLKRCGFPTEPARKNNWQKPKESWYTWSCSNFQDAFVSKFQLFQLLMPLKN